MTEGQLGVMIPIVAIVGGLVIAALSMHHRNRLRELQYRERIAMIERGLVPPPEVSPKAFEDAFGPRLERRFARRMERRRSAGITMVAVGVGLMVMMYIQTGGSRSAIGAGAFVAIIGIAFIITAALAKRDRDHSGPPTAPPPPSSSSLT